MHKITKWDLIIYLGFTIGGMGIPLIIIGYSPEVFFGSYRPWVILCATLGAVLLSIGFGVKYPLDIGRRR